MYVCMYIGEEFEIVASDDNADNLGPQLACFTGVQRYKKH